MGSMFGPHNLQTERDKDMDNDREYDGRVKVMEDRVFRGVVGCSNMLLILFWFGMTLISYVSVAEDFELGGGLGLMLSVMVVSVVNVGMVTFTYIVLFSIGRLRGLGITLNSGLVNLWIIILALCNVASVWFLDLGEVGVLFAMLLGVFLLVVGSMRYVMWERMEGLNRRNLPIEESSDYGE